jgi:hypothetical protein
MVLPMYTVFASITVLYGFGSVIKPKFVKNVAENSLMCLSPLIAKARYNSLLLRRQIVCSSTSSHKILGVGFSCTLLMEYVLSIVAVCLNLDLVHQANSAETEQFK